MIIKMIITIAPTTIPITPLELMLLEVLESVVNKEYSSKYL